MQVWLQTSRLFDLCRMADSNKPISPIWEHDATPTASIAMMTLFLDYSLCCTAFICSITIRLGDDANIMCCAFLIRLIVVIMHYFAFIIKFEYNLCLFVYCFYIPVHCH